MDVTNKISRIPETRLYVDEPQSADMLGGTTRQLPFQIQTFVQLIEQAQLDWLIDDVLPAGRTAMLFGVPGSYKTFVALDMALAIAVGKQWQGHKTKSGPVIFISGEGQAGLGYRVEAWCRQRGLESVPDQAYVIAKPVQFRDPREVEILRQEMARRGIQPRLIVIDTLARCFGGGDENSPVDTGAFIMGTDRIREVTGATILVIHHPDANNTKPRGHSSLEGAMDTVLRIIGATKKGLTLHCRKQKDAEEFSDIQFGLEVRHLGNGASSLVLSKQDRAGRQTTGSTSAADKNAQEFLALIRELGDEAYADTVAKLQGRSTTTVTNYARTLERRGLLNVRLVKHGRTRKNLFVLNE